MTAVKLLRDQAFRMIVLAEVAKVQGWMLAHDLLLDEASVIRQEADALEALLNNSGWGTTEGPKA